MKNLRILLFSHFYFIGIFYSWAASGYVFDAESKKPLAFVNIGIPGKNLGTVSLRDGSFGLNTNLHSEEILRFSMVGYQPIDFRINQLPDTVYLVRSTTQLQEVLVRTKKLKKGFLGNRTSSKIIYGGYKKDFPGAEAGVLMKVKRTPTWVNNFHFFISYNDYDSIRFRVNIYEMDGEEVVKKILHKNLLINEVKIGWNSVNLEPYNVVARNDFLVTLEWLTDFPCRKTEKNELGEKVPACRLMFSATLFKGEIYYRDVSQGELLKFTGGSFGFLVGVEY